MNDDFETTLDDDVVALLRHAKSVPELAPAAKSRLFAEVAARVGIPPLPGGDGGDGGAGGAAGPDPASASAPIGAATGTPGALALTGTKGLAALAATFAVGLATGVAVDRNLAPTATVTPAPATSVVVVRAPEPSAREEAPAIPVAALPPAPEAPRATAPARPEPTTPPAPSARGLAAERALLDVARGALARGEAKEALEAAQRHAGEYPAGSLVEEREAIAVRALVALGRRDEARARAAEMERRFPNGLMLRAVKAAVDSP